MCLAGLSWERDLSGIIPAHPLSSPPFSSFKPLDAGSYVR